MPSLVDHRGADGCVAIFCGTLKCVCKEAIGDFSAQSLVQANVGVVWHRHRVQEDCGGFTGSCSQDTPVLCSSTTGTCPTVRHRCVS